MQRENDLVLIVRVNEDIKAVVRLARQINMLALNAILVARRAGAVAMGFGVIADELRSFSLTLTQSMQSLMMLSYESIQIVSAHQRQQRATALLEQVSAQLAQTDFYNRAVQSDLGGSNLQHSLLQTFGALEQLILDAEDVSRFGTVISRSLKIEATYGQGFTALLGQISLDFGSYIDAIPDVLVRLHHLLKVKL